MGMESRDEFSDRNLLSQVELKIESLRAFFFFIDSKIIGGKIEWRIEGILGGFALVEITRIKFECNENIYVLFIGMWAVAVSRVCSFI